MSPRWVTVFIVVALFSIFFVGSVVPQAFAVEPDVKLGVFFPDPQLPDEQLPSVGDLHDFETVIGRQTDVFLWYESISEDFYADNFRPMAQEGRIIQLAWEPHDFSRPATNQPEYRLERITAGDFDNDIKRWARQLRDFGYPIYFRPMCEMNGDWVTWGGTVNGNTPDDYIPAWRHVHDIFVQEGATNVKWIWSPNRDGSTADAQATFNTYYPGDGYVDYIGINGYNWGTLYNTPDWTSSWQSFENVIGYSYDVAVANTSKPVVIAETATTEVGGNAQNGGKGQWIRDAFASLPTRFPRIEMLTWFNINKETDWRVDSSAASLGGFRDAVQSPDATPPTVTLTSPTAGSVISGNANVAVNASDDDSVARVELFIGDNMVGSATAAPYNFTLSSGAFADGSYTLTAKAFDPTGNYAVSSVTVTVSNGTVKNYYFGRYDNVTSGMQNWIIIGNPGNTTQRAEVYIGGTLMGTYDIAPLQRATPIYAGVAGGPVKVVSTTGGDLLVSERVTLNGTFAEIPAVPEVDLSSDQLLSWYDEQTAGMQNWVVVGNQGNQTALVDIYVAGQLMGNYSVPSGSTISPHFPGTMNGPVRIVATNGQPLNVSSRVIFNGAFNEVGGKPAQELASEYNFTWYDEQSVGMQTWIVVGNQGSQTAEVGIYVAERLVGLYSIPAGGRVTPDYPNLMNGPVRITCTNGQPLIVGQRSLYRGSFEEVPGTNTTDLASEQWFTWYDNATSGMQTWVLVGNQSTQTAEVDIVIGGEVMDHYSIPAGGRVTPAFPGRMDGPVQVVSTSGAPQLVVSQRTLFNNSFDELPGMLLR
ncbi:MAG: Ig-like domain-containing protein [Thermoleophilia bacterium]